MLRDLTKLAVVFCILGLIWLGILVADKVTTLDGIVNAYEYQLFVPKPVTEDLIAYQESTGLADDDDSRFSGWMIAFLVFAVLMTLIMASVLAIGPGGMNELLRRISRMSGGRPAHKAPAALPKITAVESPPDTMALPAPIDRSSLGANEWLLPPGR